MERHGEVINVRGRTDIIINNVEEKIVRREYVASWRKEWCDKASGSESTYFYNHCGEWQRQWTDFVNRKLEFLNEQTKTRIAEFGADDFTAKKSKEKATALIAHIRAIKEFARSMSAVAEEMLYCNDLREMKADLKVRIIALDV